MITKKEIWEELQRARDKRDWKEVAKQEKEVYELKGITVETKPVIVETVEVKPIKPIVKEVKKKK
jgi:hypothetical protein